MALLGTLFLTQPTPLHVGATLLNHKLILKTMQTQTVQFTNLVDKRDKTDTLITSLIFILPTIHILLSPYTKVEESFTLQATHDILIYGTPTANIHTRFLQTYDHFTFPGAVPRTFVGSVVLAGLSQPILALIGFQHAQLVVRCVLGLFNAGCLVVFKNAAQNAFGKGTGRWWVVLMMSQFHLVYYLGRTLPNMFAFGMSMFPDI